ncbi:MAG: hypothetical protein ACREBC_19560 [Pyrinomonadaceae bacterium]
MTVRPRGRKRTHSKHVSSFNMWMDQVHQVRAIMEETGAVKDAPVIRELLDEALGARRRKAAGIYDSEEPPGQGTAETLHTLQTLLLKLIRHEDLLLRNQRVGLKFLLETFVEARTGRDVAWEEVVRRPLIERGRTDQDLVNYFDMKTHYAKEYALELLEKIKKEESERR